MRGRKRQIVHRSFKYFIRASQVFRFGTCCFSQVLFSMFYTIIIPPWFCFIPVFSREWKRQKKKKRKKERTTHNIKTVYDLHKLNDIFFVCVCYGFNFYKYFIALNSKARRKNEIGQDFGGRYSIRFWHFPFVFSRLK